ncbi:hypothetical protein M514_08348 [Trichuris suis]|uniref:Reverse transcriptase Ty1/copia-type domain-containing protein n=1 Tax=Trichuris suis TaxID=68888 RepID=A0A085N1P5_9BILA|nr:hypothetical protein M513_08348 [Trichuris suis]KFD63391.1 hypothetical protein M514_08348 [Trichuris suis]
MEPFYSSICSHLGSISVILFFSVRCHPARPFFLDKDGSEDTNAVVPCKDLIGSLLYLAQRTSLDVYYWKLAQYCSSFTMQHEYSAKRVLRYLKETVETRIVY